MNEKYHILILIISYVIPLKIIFDYVYKTSTIVIDEIFHLPLGLQYCSLEFSKWDNKVTTLPGLYLYSTLITSLLGKCTVYALRYTIMIASVINVFLIYYLRKHWHPNEHISTRVLNTFNIVTIPPVLFFSTLYYTDILSMTLVNAMLLLGFKGQHFLASIFGFLAMGTRQNNAIYILFIAGYTLLGDIHNILSGASYLNINITNWDTRYLKSKVRIFLDDGFFSHNYTTLLINGFCYLEPLLSMLVFIYLNGSVVVGDKAAHETTIHIPQLLYFSMFAMFFCWPHANCHFLPFLKFCLRHMDITSISLFLIFLCIKLNTIIHPYLLADNRHYLFYLWKYFLGTEFQRLILCPMYYCALFCLCRLCYRPSEPRFAILYPLMLTAILCTQSLIDIRYFLTPYVMLRTFMAPTLKLDLIVEFFFQLSISGYTLFMFGHKEIYWVDFVEAQRLIW